MTLNGLLLNPRMPDFEAAALRHGWESVGEVAFPHHVAVATSGSSGAPRKLVALSHAALESSARSMNLRLKCEAHDIWYKTLPDFHVGGIGIRVRAQLAGCEIIQAPSDTKWNPSGLAGAIGDCGATLVSLVPTQLFDLARAGVRAPRCLRTVVVGGGALAESVRAAACDLGWPVLASYGLSECASTVAIADDQSDLVDSAASVDSAVPRLRLLSHVEARVDNDGLLLLKSPALLSGYVLFDGEPRAIDPKRSGGWFKTEDQALLHDKFLKPLGRDIDFIKIGGEQSSLARLEAIFDQARMEAGGSADAVLVAIADERLGHSIRLLCACTDIDQATALAARYNLKVHPFERVRGIHACERIPRSPLGKVLRKEAMAFIVASDHA